MLTPQSIRASRISLVCWSEPSGLACSFQSWIGVETWSPKLSSGLSPLLVNERRIKRSPWTKVRPDHMHPIVPTTHLYRSQDISADYSGYPPTKYPLYPLPPGVIPNTVGWPCNYHKTSDRYRACRLIGRHFYL